MNLLEITLFTTIATPSTYIWGSLVILITFHSILNLSKLIQTTQAFDQLFAIAWANWSSSPRYSRRLRLSLPINRPRRIKSVFVISKKFHLHRSQPVQLGLFLSSKLACSTPKERPLVLDLGTASPRFKKACLACGISYDDLANWLAIIVWIGKNNDPSQLLQGSNSFQVILIDRRSTWSHRYPPHKKNDGMCRLALYDNHFWYFSFSQSRPNTFLALS